MKRILIMWLMSVALVLCSLMAFISAQKLRSLEQRIVAAERACQPTKSASLR